jgi:hypothetical protein
MTNRDGDEPAAHQRASPNDEAPAPEADALTIAEAILLRFGDGIGDPTKQDSHAKLYATLIGVRAKSLYANFIHSLSSPADIGPILALRPLVEAAILAKWISLNPKLHGELWFAQSEDRDLTAIREAEKHLGIRVRGDIPTSSIVESVEQKTAWRDEAVARSKAAGKTYGDRPMPHIDRMVAEIEKGDPGHKMAMRQAYDGVYRSVSPWEHTEAASFKATAEESETGLTFLGDVCPYQIDLLRLIAGAMFAYILEIVGLAVGDGSEVAARFIRDYLTMVHPTEAAPPPDKRESAQA